jgi:hypothetical protein
MIQIKVKGKNRLIRNKFVFYQSEYDLECTYKNHHINIAEQETGGFYVTVTDKTGMYAVDGYFNEYHNPPIKTIEECLEICIENILI